MKKLAMVFGCLLQFALSSSSNAADANHPYMLGVGVHHGTFIETPRYNVGLTQEALHTYGFQSFRDDFGWSFLEGNPTPDFPQQLLRLKTVIQGMMGSAVPVLALTSGSPLFNDGVLPVTPQAQDSYAAFTARAAKLLNKYQPILEIWNEWNLGTGTRAHKPGTAADYVALAKKAHSAIEQAVPGSQILVGGMGTDVDPMPLMHRPWVWTREAIGLGLLDAGTGMSVHLYNICKTGDQRRPVELIDRLQQLDSLIRESRPAGYPLYVTEVGWPDRLKTCGYSDEEQISFSSQFLFWATKFPTLKGVWLYELKNNGADQNDIEDRFGLLDNAYKKKPYICGVTDSWSALSHAKFTAEHRQPDGSVDIEFDVAGQKMDAMWLGTAAAKASFVIPAGRQAKYICEDETYKSGTQVDLRDRPLVVTKAN